MGEVHERLDARLVAWLEAQPVFFVATAPVDSSGLVNCSPKGLAGTFRVVDERRVAYLDLTGSGIETVAHLRENGRIVLMFCAFDGPPRIVRLHGAGRVITTEDVEFDQLLPGFSPHPGVRSIIVVDISRIADSCGYAVPLMTYQGDRDLLDRSAAKKGPVKLVEYRAARNALSLDGLPGLPGEVRT